MKYILLCSCLLVVGSLLGTHGEVVTLPGLGDIEGSTTYSYLLHRLIYQFQGIPYAKPPVGDLRFKRPQKWDDPWTERRNCKTFRAVCPQYFTHEYPEEEQSEDCLHINVYTKKLWGGGNGTGQAVMFYIHGGSFRMGSARPYTPEYLLDVNVVLVVLQYRLGPLGFLSLKTDDIPGNMGMLDMILALEWVRDNIHVFGGDANKVTLFGNSAGAAAVSLMLFSPLVDDGLFQRVIVQSGSPMGDWAIDVHPVPHARWIANRAGCNKRNSTTYLARCLRRKPYRLILKKHDAFKGGYFGGYPRMSSAGNHIVWNEAGSKSFLTRDPAVLLQKGKVRRVPMMAGTTKHEGSAFLHYFHYILGPDEISTKTESVEYEMVREVLRLCGVKDRTGYLETFLQQQYFKESEVGNFTAMVPGLVDILGTALIKSSVVALAKANSRHENTYLYSFNFYGSHTGKRFFKGFPLPWPAGITHEDELLYLFPQGKVLNSPERAISHRMVEMWTSFAKTGVPKESNYNIAAWPPMSTPEGPYLSIDTVPKVLQSFVKEEYMTAVKDGMTDPSLTQPNF